MTSTSFLEKAPPKIRFYNQFPFRSTFWNYFMCSKIAAQAEIKNGPFSGEIASCEDFPPFEWMTY